VTVLEALTFTVHVAPEAPEVEVHPVHPPKLPSPLVVAVRVTVVAGIATLTPGQSGPQLKSGMAGRKEIVPLPVPDFATVRTKEPRMGEK
jgi:hypothetical protein